MKKVFGYIILAAAVGLIIFIFAGASYSNNGETCKGCHEMKVPVEKWAKSAHEGIECMTCHARPTWGGLLKAKASGVGEVARHLVLAVLKKPVDPALIHARVSPERCRKCHKIEDIRPFNKRMDHQLHLDASFTCIDCHSRTAHGTYEERKVLTDRQRCQKCHRRQ